ncbi:MAG: hypothetical protein R2864_06145 [Syntrophotaleaceae bacterium]
MVFICNRCPPMPSPVAAPDTAGRVAGQVSGRDGRPPSRSPDYPDDAPPRMIELAAELGIFSPYLVDDSQQVARAFRHDAPLILTCSMQKAGSSTAERIDDLVSRTGVCFRARACRGGNAGEGRTTGGAAVMELLHRSVMESLLPVKIKSPVRVRTGLSIQGCRRLSGQSHFRAG